jgi:hypothetical protein
LKELLEKKDDEITMLKQQIEQMGRNSQDNIQDMYYEKFQEMFDRAHQDIKDSMKKVKLKTTYVSQPSVTSSAGQVS